MPDAVEAPRTRQELAAQLSVTPDNVGALVVRRQMIELVTSDGHRRYPAWQVRGGRPAAGVGEAIDALPEPVVNAWTLTAWLSTPHGDLGGRSVAAVLAANTLTGAVQLVCRRADIRWSR